MEGCSCGLNLTALGRGLCWFPAVLPYPYKARVQVRVLHLW